VSEIYGSSGGYDRNGDASRGYGRSSYPIDANGQESWAEDAEPVGRGAWVDYVRNHEQSGIDDANDDDPWATDPDLENYANGNYPEIAWRNQGNPDSPNGFGRLDTTDFDGVSDTGDHGKWGDTYPDDAADYADTSTSAAGTLIAELDNAPAETRDRPTADAQGDDTSSKSQDRVDGHDADIYAILHENDHLPEPRTRQEAAREGRQAEADCKRAPGLTEPSTIPDGEAYWSWEDGLPTRQESREKTWGLDAEFWDENEQAWRKVDTAPEPDGEGAADTMVIGDRQHGEHTYPAAEHDETGHGETSAADRTVETDDALRQRVADLKTANAELKSENSQLGKGLSELESENADLGKTVAALEARLERLEQRNSDSRAGDGDIDNRTRGGLAENSARPEHEQKRRLPSDEALLFGATGVGGAITTAAYYLSYIRPDVAGITASLLGTAAAGVAWIHKRREARHADRSKD
jgi:flagellin-like hook-associated protein FlgL